MSKPMKNYICLNEQKIQLTEDQVEKIRNSLGVTAVKLAHVSPGEVARIGDHEFVVLEQSGDATSLILKDFLYEGKPFGKKNNNFAESSVDQLCQKFADELSESIGGENLVQHTVDLTSDDGLKDYGTVQRRVSLLTTDLYRRYVEILDRHKPDAWWWLATPYSTPRHSNSSWVKCVSPSGSVDDDSGSYGGGVRPFCILKSNIFVSK